MTIKANIETIRAFVEAAASRKGAAFCDRTLGVTWCVDAPEISVPGARAFFAHVVGVSYNNSGQQIEKGSKVLVILGHKATSRAKKLGALTSHGYRIHDRIVVA